LRTTRADEIRRLLASPDVALGSVSAVTEDGSRAAYGVPSAVNRLLVMNAEPVPGRAAVLLLREAIGY
jgi:hypothetical protein